LTFPYGTAFWAPQASCYPSRFNFKKYYCIPIFIDDRLFKAETASAKSNKQEAAVAEEVPEEYFADLISNVSHANGVFRLTFAQRETADNVRPVVRVLIPANQLQNALRSITGAANEIRDKVQAQIDENADNNVAMGEPAVGE